LPRPGRGYEIIMKIKIYLKIKKEKKRTTHSNFITITPISKLS
jgi:hypothetical protein